MPNRNRQSDVSGNAMASAQAFNKELARIGEKMLQLNQTIEALLDDDVLVTGMNVQAATGGRADWLVVIRATTGDQRIVCFCNGDTLHGALSSFVGLHRSGTLRWKNDQYAK